MVLLITILCYLSGSFMFSYWIGLLLNKNIREIGDGNPGAANLWKAAGYKYGLFGIVLDFLKGYAPLFFVITFNLAEENQLIPIALAPIVGHAYSPFLKMRGGKSLAVSFGVWSALTAFKAALDYAIILATLYVLFILVKKGKKSTSDEDGFQTTLGMLLLAIILYVQSFPSYILWIWFGNFIILFVKNKNSIHHVLKNLLNKEEKQFPV